MKTPLLVLGIGDFFQMQVTLINNTQSNRGIDEYFKSSSSRTKLCEIENWSTAGTKNEL